MSDSERALIERGKSLITDLVSKWSDRYLYLVTFTGSEFDQYSYTTEFSKPTSTMPVPKATVKVHFTVTFGIGDDSDIEFMFENESLRHRPNRTIRIPQMESWIDRVYEDKMKIRTMMNLVTKFESTRLLEEPEIDEDAFYEGCYLLESTLGEIIYDDELDPNTLEFRETIIRISAELVFPHGVSQPKSRITKISTFDAIAQVLGKVEEQTGKRVGEKTPEQKYNEVFKLYPHIGEAEARLGEFKYHPDPYYLDYSESGELERIPIDKSFKRQKKEAQVLPDIREGGEMAQYIYKGEWDKKKGNKDGRGVFLWPEGVMYIGDVHEDTINGYGRFIHRYGEVYEGDWFNGKANGYGKYYHNSGVTYEGQFLNDLPHGKGKEMYADDFWYEGEFVSGSKKGVGTIVFPDGSTYTGHWDNNLMNGNGKCEWPDGRSYDGEWHHGKMQGRGTFTWPDGRNYIGEYMDDQKSGYGEYFWEDGRIYRGPWLEGRQHGEGYYTSAEGVTRRGLWKLGKRQKWFKEQS